MPGRTALWRVCVRLTVTYAVRRQGRSGRCARQQNTPSRNLYTIDECPAHAEARGSTALCRKVVEIELPPRGG